MTLNTIRNTTTADDVFHHVIGKKGDAVRANAGLQILSFLDLRAVRLLERFVQRTQVRKDQAQQHQRDRDHVKSEKRFSVASETT